MGLLSSSKSSSTTNVFDRRIGATDNANVAAEGATIIQTDLGAVELGATVALQSTLSSERSTEKLIRANERIIGDSLDTIEFTFDRSLDTVDNVFDDSLDFLSKGNNASLG
ncbi:MAG: hypothetical protein P8P30_01990, partial [Rickettsiales bacterium]|nr:hypothetical protein [Rickettsiales bacterium]